MKISKDDWIQNLYILLLIATKSKVAEMLAFDPHLKPELLFFKSVYIN